MIPRDFGHTGLRVSPLGFGAMQVGDPRIDDAEAARMLHGALDLGITLIDTARSYGLSEERIGRHLSARRDEFVLSTKVGYGIDGVPDWTYDCVMAGVDEARDRLRTDVIDVVHLHSCPIEVLEHGEVIRALERSCELGKLRVVAYSGDDTALAYAVRCGRFQSVQASVSVCDQQAAGVLADAADRGLGVIAKRVFAGRPWAPAADDADDAHREYRRRYAALASAGLPEPDDGWDAAALRFAASTPGVACVLVGGTNLGHLQRNVAVIESLFGICSGGGTTRGRLAKAPAFGARARIAGESVESLLGNRFVDRLPDAPCPAPGSPPTAATPTRRDGIDGSQNAAMPTRRGGSEGVPANKAIPEERLGRYPLDPCAAEEERLGRGPLDSAIAAASERKGIRATWQRVGADWRGLV